MANGFRGAIFDVDGVLVDSPHEKAWREGLRQLMENDWSDIRDQTSWAPDAFTPQVYQREMSGKPRYKGAQAALEYFDVPDAKRRAQEYGDRKQEMIVELIEAADFEEYPDALRFVLALKEAGVLIAAASSSSAREMPRAVNSPAFAAWMPLAASSTTKASSGGTPISSAAAWNIIGCGLPCSKSRPLTSPSRISSSVKPGVKKP